MSKSKPLSILLVEDSDDDIFFFKRIINRSKVNVSLQIARTGEAAMEYLRAVQQGNDVERFPRPDIMFLDLKLPQFSGFDILRWMGEVGLLAKLPVVVLTGSEEERDRRLVRSLGGKEYFTKPLRERELMETIKSFLGALPTQN